MNHRKQKRDRIIEFFHSVIKEEDYRNIVKDEIEAPDETPDFIFLLKKSEIQSDVINIRRTRWEEGISILESGTGGDIILEIEEDSGILHIGNMHIRIRSTGKSANNIFTNDEQEILMCNIFNSYIETGGYMGVSDTKYGMSWIDSSVRHTKNLIQFIKDRDLPVSKYFMAHCRDKNDSIVSIYTDLLNRYRILLNNEMGTSIKRNEVIDPADVLLYNKEDAAEIIKTLSDIIGKETYGDMLEAYREYIKNTHSFLPISLKKSNSGSCNDHVILMIDPDLAESGDIKLIVLSNGRGKTPDRITGEDLKEYKIIDKNGKYYLINSENDIDLDNTTYISAEVICLNPEFKDDNIVMSYRLFGKGKLGIDIKKESTISLGKASSSVWRDIIFGWAEPGTPEYSDLTARTKAEFVKLFINFNTNKEKIDKIINSGLKRGDFQFPYLLLK